MAIKNEDNVFSEPEGTQHTVRTETVMEGTRKNSRGRLIMIIMGVLIFIVLAFAVVGLMGKGKKTGDSGAVPAPADVGNVPGGNSSPVYGEMVDEENIRKAADPGTSLPVLTGSEQSTGADPFSPLPVTPPVSQPEVVTPPAPIIEQPIQQPIQPQPQQQPVMYAPPVEQGPRHSQEEYASMSSALQAYIESWKVAPVPTQEFSFNGTTPSNLPQPAQGVPVAANGAVALNSNGTVAGSTAMGSSTIDGPSLVRAGTVIPAVLLSAINSDNPGPILAQITSGPLAGTRLIGEFRNTGKALVLNFATLSRPGMGTFSVNAVAVDDNYAVGMQTDVNNHYFRRYGLLLAASLLQGYGEAIGRSNTTTVTGPFGSTVTQGELTNEQARNVAYGKVGEAVSENLLTESDVAPTVKLDCRGGCPIGLLFLSDL